MGRKEGCPPDEHSRKQRGYFFHPLVPRSLFGSEERTDEKYPWVSEDARRAADGN